MTSKLIEEVDSSDDGCHIAGLVDHDAAGNRCALRSIPWLGTFDRLSEIVERVRPSRIVVALADRRGRLPLVSLLESRIRGVVVEDALEFYEHLTGKIAIEELTPGTLILAKGFRHDGVGPVLARIISMSVAIVRARRVARLSLRWWRLPSSSIHAGRCSSPRSAPAGAASRSVC